MVLSVVRHHGRRAHGLARGTERPTLAAAQPSGVLPVAHAQTAGLDVPLVFALAAAGVASALLTAAALVAFLRRRSRPYLLVALALAALLARSVVAGASVGGLLAGDVHHVLEHGLDVLMAGLVIAAVWYARSVAATTAGGGGR